MRIGRGSGEKLDKGPAQQMAAKESGKLLRKRDASRTEAGRNR